MVSEKSDFTRTLYLPDIPGQFKLWKKEVINSTQRAHFTIQMGNFISCDDDIKDSENSGPNQKLLEFIFLWRSTDPRWTQLVGPNEIVALNNPSSWTNLRSQSFLQGSWLSKTPKMFTATSNRGRLVTHGGLTYGEWRNIGYPETAEEAVEKLNQKYKTTLYQGPCYRLGDIPNYEANPIWADPVMELVPSWITAPVQMPFDQIISSGPINGIFGTAAMDNKTSPMFYVDKIQNYKYGSKVWVKEMAFISLDLKLIPGKIADNLPKESAFYVEKTKKDS